MPSFVEDVAAAVDALGPEPVGIIWGIGLTDWASAEDRDEFLAAVSGKVGNVGSQA
jgi:hypothetical protein